MTKQAQESQRVSVLDQSNAGGSAYEPSGGGGSSQQPGRALALAVLVPLILVLVGGYLLFKGSKEVGQSLREGSGILTPRPAELDKSLPPVKPKLPRKEAQSEAETPAAQPAAAPPPGLPADDNASAGQPALPQSASPAPDDGQTVSGEQKKRAPIQSVENDKAEQAASQPEPASPATPPAGAGRADQDQPEIAALTRAIEDDHQSVQAWKNRAEAHRIAKNMRASIADYDMAVALDPQAALTFNDRGIVYFQMGQYERARNDLNWALTLDPGEKLALFNRGLLHFELGQYAAAESDFGAFVKQEPEDGEAWRRRGQSRFSLGNWDGAIDDYTKAIAIDANDTEALAFRCGAQINLEKYDRAEADCRAALKIDDGLALALNNLAWLHYKRAEHREGLALAEKAVKAAPEDANYWDTRAHLLEALGERDLAISDYRAALKRNPKLKESIAGLKRLGEEP